MLSRGGGNIACLTLNGIVSLRDVVCLAQTSLVHPKFFVNVSNEPKRLGLAVFVLSPSPPSPGVIVQCKHEYPRTVEEFIDYQEVTCHFLMSQNHVPSEALQPEDTRVGYSVSHSNVALASSKRAAVLFFYKYRLRQRKVT